MKIRIFFWVTLIYLFSSNFNAHSQENTPSLSATSPVIATINNLTITKDELDKELSKYPPETKDTFTEEALRNLALNKLILIKSEELGLTVTSDEISQFKAEIKKLAGGANLSSDEDIKVKILEGKLIENQFGESAYDDEAMDYFDYLKSLEGNESLGQIPFDEVSNELKRQVLLEKTSAKWADWLSGEIAKQDVKIIPEFEKTLNITERNYAREELSIKNDDTLALAYVNGIPVLTVRDFNERVSEFPQNTSLSLKQARLEIVNILINEKLLAIESESKGYLDNKDIMMQIEKAKKDIKEGYREKGIYDNLSIEDLKKSYEDNISYFKRPPPESVVSFIVGRDKKSLEDINAKIKSDNFEEFAFSEDQP